MNKNVSEKTANNKKLEAEKLKKQKAREKAKAKKLALIEKRKAKAEANKKKREEKKLKKLAKLEKIKAKKAAQKAKKQEIRQKKLERIAKQKAKAKEMKLKAKQKAKLQKQKEAAKQTEASKAKDTIDITVKILKNYVKQLAKDASGIDDKKIKKLNALGFVFDEETVSFKLEAVRKVKKAKKPAEKPVEAKIEEKKPEEVQTPEVIEPEVIPANTNIETAIDEVISDKSKALESLAAELEADSQDGELQEIPVGDTFTDDLPAGVNDGEQPNDFDDDEDESYVDHRDESDEEKIAFRKEWNSEFGEDDGNSEW